MKHAYIFALVAASTITTGIMSKSSACDKAAKSAAAAKPVPPQTAPAQAPVQTETTAPVTIAIEVNNRGFSPNKITVKKNVPVVLTFTRTSDKTCAKTVVVAVGDGSKVERTLPLNQTVALAITFTKSGELSYSCKMDMVTGVVSVQ